MSMPKFHSEVRALGWRPLYTAALMLLLSGCTSLVAPAYAPDYEALDRLKATKPGKVAVGQFQPREQSAPVNRITLRGASLAAPAGTFTQYLEDAVVRDLREIGVLDPNSSTRIEALVLKNDVDISGFVTGVGLMEVQFTVTRGTQLRLKKTYRGDTTFESSFAGMVAVPKGQSEYSSLVRALLKVVYSDADFVTAIKEIP